jgi:4-diphosphocytidyl-2-C-methyl-D-erythritol kinase
MISAFAAAKINLCLHLNGRRPDGYHDLESLVIFADIGDHLRVLPSRRQHDCLRMTGDFSAAIDDPDHNLVTATIAAFRQHYPQAGPVAVDLQKNLPVGAGIGGGSSDAAACLRALCQINGINLGAENITAIARSLGADVPVCVTARPAVIRGTGAEIEPLANWPGFGLVLLNPGVKLSTAAVFAAHDGGSSGVLQNAQAIGNQRQAVNYLKNTANDLTPAAIKAAPVVQQALDLLGCQAQVLHHGMSGSGATCFGLFSDLAVARAAAKKLQEAAPDWWIRSAVSYPARANPWSVD